MYIMNKLPKELLIHIFTYINVMSSEIKPLLEINKDLRKLLWTYKITLDHYPDCVDETIVCISKCYMDYLSDLRKEEMEMELYGYEIDTHSIDESIEMDIEVGLNETYLNFPPF